VVYNLILKLRFDTRPILAIVTHSFSSESVAGFQDNDHSS